MKTISNVELALLELIAESKLASGYELDALVDKRGFRQWAGIGPTSIYVSLRKLKNKAFIAELPYEKRSGKGPAPKKYGITKKGAAVMKETISRGLSENLRGGAMFDLCIAGIGAIGAGAASVALGKRVRGMADAEADLSKRFEMQGGARLPIFVAALFERPLRIMRADLGHTKELIIKLKRGNI